MTTIVDAKAVKANRRIERLRELLDMRFWRLEWAVFIVFGADPELTERGNTQGWGFVWLPNGDGGRLANPDGQEKWARDLNDDGDLEYIRMCLEASGNSDVRSPSEWVLAAIEQDCNPPWLAAALADEHCRNRLTAALIQRVSETDTGKATAPAINAAASAERSRLAKQARQASPSGKAMAVIKSWIEEELINNPNKLTVRPSTKEFANELQERYDTFSGKKDVVTARSIENKIREVKAELIGKHRAGHENIHQLMQSTLLESDELHTHPLDLNSEDKDAKAGQEKLGDVGTDRDVSAT